MTGQHNTLDLCPLHCSVQWALRTPVLAIATRGIERGKEGEGLGQREEGNPGKESTHQM